MQTSAPDISCQQFVELVTEYLESALPPELRDRCNGHAANCAPCATYLEQVRRTVLMLGRLIDETVEPASREELVRRFRAWQDEHAA